MSLLFPRDFVRNRADDQSYTGFRAPDDLPDELRTPLYAKTRTMGFGDEVKKRILLGTFALSAEYAWISFVQSH